MADTRPVDPTADAEADELRNELLGRTLGEWSIEHGPPTPEQRAEAAAFFDRLGAPPPEPSIETA